MREAITHDDLLKMVEIVRWDAFPDFLREHREYASRMGFAMPMGTAAERERARDLMTRVQKLELPGVPRGL